MNIISYVVIALAELIVIDITANRIFQCAQKTFLCRACVYGIYLSFATIQPLLHYNAYLNTLIALLLTIIVSFSYTANLLTHLIISLTSVAISICGEGTLWILIRGFTDLSGIDISPKLWYFPMTTFATAAIKVILSLLICYIIEYCRVNIKTLYVALVALTSVLLISFPIILVTFADTPYLSLSFAVLGLVLIAMALCVGLFRDQMRVQQERLRLDFLERQNQDQVAHYTALYDRNNETHRLRHDLHNFLLSAQTLIDLGDIEKLKEHIEKKREAVRPQKLTDTGNPLLDAVLSAKQHDSPEIDFQILLPQLNCEHIDPMDTAMLLAAALDNAVEGCTGCPEPYIQLRVEQKGYIIHFDIQNPTHNKPREQLGRLVSTKAEPEKHGYGVLSMRRIAERYNGNLIWNVENGVFILRVLMQDIPPISSPQK